MNAIDAWRTAVDEAGLEPEDVERVISFVEEDGDLREELTWLVRSLSENRGGPFLRELAARLRADELREGTAGANAAIMDALTATVLDGGRS